MAPNAKLGRDTDGIPSDLEEDRSNAGCLNLSAWANETHGCYTSEISCPFIGIIGCMNSKLVGTRQKPSSEHPTLEAHSRFAGLDLVMSRHLDVVTAKLA